MSCAHFLAAEPGCDGAFTVDASRITFGRGVLAEAGERARALGIQRIALFTDPRIRNLQIYRSLYDSLRAAGLDLAVYDQCRCEPTDESFRQAIAFARDAQPDGYISLGGGSVIDTCKAANLYATWPAELLAYVNAPIGEARPIPGELKPHLACPTTSGTGSEVTGIAVCDFLSLHVKSGISSVKLRPTEALVDADCTNSLPAEVVASSGFDVLSHALESYTARPYIKRPAPARPTLRPLSQGRNPWSDLGCREALRLLGLYLARAVTDATDREAREQTMWAATLAGIAFGNAGVHIPHAMSYAVAGLVHDYLPRGYHAEAAMVPHGISVILNAPAVFRMTAQTSPERHLEAAILLGAGARETDSTNAGEVLAAHLSTMMRQLGMPNGLAGVGYSNRDIDDLVKGSFAQQRLLQNAPQPVAESDLAALFASSMQAWVDL